MNALAPIHPPFTSAEFHRMAEKGAFGGMRVELRRGMILKMSPQHYPHGRAKADLQYALRDAIRTAGLAWEALTEVIVSYGAGFEPMPDIVVIDPSLLPASPTTLPPAAVKLVVEVADSSLADDMGEKREDYASCGCPEYWVADVNAGCVFRHAGPEGGRYTLETAAISVGAPLAMLTCPDIVTRVQP